MYSDSQSSYIHLEASHHALYISDWVHDKLPFEEIDTPGVNIDDENDTNNIQNTTFGVSKARQKNHEPAWKDLNLSRFINDEDGFVDTVQDKTILKKLERFDGFTTERSSLSADNSIVDDQSDSNSSFNSSMANYSPNNIPNFEITTPSVSRTTTTTSSSFSAASSSRNPQNFQTPIGRIMR